MKKLLYSILLLDADGTILDFDRAERAAFTKTLRRFGMPRRKAKKTYPTYQKINDDLWKAHERGEVEKDRLKTLRYERLLRDTPDSAKAKEISVAYEEALGHEGQLLPHARRSLRRLRRNGARLFLITNGIASSQYGRIAAAGIGPLFEGLFISEELGISKPDPRFFEAVAGKIRDYDPAAALVVGDRPTSDLAGAASAGLPAVWIAPADRETDQPYRYRCPDLRGLLPFLKEESK